MNLIRFIKIYRLLLVAQVIFCSVAFATVHDDLARFRKSPRTSLAGAHKAMIDQFHYVFVGGYMNEFARSHYFDLNVKALEEEGATFVSKIFPDSYRSAGENREILLRQLLKLHKLGEGRPIVLVGHSKGALEVLATALKYPHYFGNEVVAQVVVVQGPVRANTLLDQRGFMGRLITNALFMLKGFSSLKTTEIKKIIEEPIAALSAEDFARLDKSVVYVLGSKLPKGFGRLSRWTAKFTPIDGPNDGLVAWEDMFLDGFGRVLGDLPEVDHVQYFMTESSPVAGNVLPQMVRAFTLSLVSNIFKSMNPRNKTYHALTDKLTVRLPRRPSGPLSCAQVLAN